jgi:ZIP family zinc transporter
MLLHALLYGLVASSALVIGGALGSVWRAPIRLTGVLLAFASGSLISALAFELFPEAVALGGLWPAGAGLLLGAFIFVVMNTWLDRRVAGEGAEKADQRETMRHAARGEGPASEPPEASGTRAGVGLALLAAVTLDGVPENLALGFSLAEEASLTLLVAIFASNLPESLVGSIAMRRAGRSKTFTVGVWAAAAGLLTVAVVLGRMALTGVSENVLVWPLSIAGGAVLASLADTLMPEAFEHGQPLNAYATALGFFVSFALAA